jgi:hypothetical protein
VLQSSGLTGATKHTNSSSALSTASQTDHSQLSPFAQITSELQQLQQSDPSKYQQVTGQIATNLQSAAQSATASGNTALAAQLNQLATDFQTASTSGQLPNFQDLAQAAAGGHHHHHSMDGSSASTGGAAGTMGQLLASLQSSGSQSDSLNPMNIILNTLSTAGIGNT